MKKTLFVAAVMVAFYSVQASAVCPIQAALNAKTKAARESCVKEALASNKTAPVRSAKSGVVR